MVTRSLRAKKGIKCDHCGCVGYFIEICPNGCHQPPPLEEASRVGLERFGSDDEEVELKESTGEGFYWSCADTNSELEKPKRSYYPTKADLSSLRQLSLDEKERLQESDAKLTDYEFHRSAQEGYAQNLSELSLHQALRYFMRILDREIQENVKRLEAKDDLTLFHPPAEALSDHFYPKEVEKIKEYRFSCLPPSLLLLSLSSLPLPHWRLSPAQRIFPSACNEKGSPNSLSPALWRPPPRGVNGGLLSGRW
jgi:hypothetical protein